MRGITWMVPLIIHFPKKLFPAAFMMARLVGSFCCLIIGGLVFRIGS